LQRRTSTSAIIVVSCWNRPQRVLDYEH
jgi:hypothetical protein